MAAAITSHGWLMDVVAGAATSLQSITRKDFEMAEIHQLETEQSTIRHVPAKIKRPCDYGLELAISSMETQVGTVEAYNKLCDAAEKLKEKIDGGKSKIAMIQFSTDPAWIYPR